MNKAKTVFITLAPFENEIHNVLYAKQMFIDKYLEEGYFVVAIIFCQKHRAIIEENRINFKVINFYVPSFINRISLIIRYLLSRRNASRLPFYMKKRWLHASKGRSCKSKILHNTFFILFGWLSENCLLYLYAKTLSMSGLDFIYKRHKPLLTILPFYFASSEEAKVISIAKNNNSLTVAIPARISAFDDVVYYAKTNLLLVWNEPMKYHAVSWHRCDKNSVIPIGILKCDYYKNNNILWQTKESFITSNKLINDRRIVSIICGNISIERACGIAMELFKSNKINIKFQILLRANPDEYENQLKELGKNNEYPVFLFKGFSSNVKENNFLGQIISTGNFIKNSDLIISVASTMCLESLYFNIPNIFLFYEEFRFYYEQDYIRQLLSEKGIKFVRNDSELIFALKEYLENPFVDTEERGRLFKKYCYSVNGDALNRCFYEISKLDRYYNTPTAYILKEKLFPGQK